MSYSIATMQHVEALRRHSDGLRVVADSLLDAVKNPAQRVDPVAVFKAVADAKAECQAVLKSYPTCELAPEPVREALSLTHRSCIECLAAFASVGHARQAQDDD